MAAYTNTGLGDLREGRHVGVLSEALSCSPKELWLSFHKATSIRTNQNSYYNWTPSPTCLYPVYTTPLQVNRPPLNIYIPKNGGTVMRLCHDYVCFLPFWLLITTWCHFAYSCKNVYKYTEVRSAQLDTGSWPPKRAKKSVDKDKNWRTRLSQEQI